jgi:hypothetical protein
MLGHADLYDFDRLQSFGVTGRPIGAGHAVGETFKVTAEERTS